jgi:hypothetical protein
MFESAAPLLPSCCLSSCNCVLWMHAQVQSAAPQHRRLFYISAALIVLGESSGWGPKGGTCSSVLSLSTQSRSVSRCGNQQCIQAGSMSLKSLQRARQPTVKRAVSACNTSRLHKLLPLCCCRHHAWCVPAVCGGVGHDGVLPGRFHGWASLWVGAEGCQVDGISS